jgi:hypothetical protein
LGCCDLRKLRSCNGLALHERTEVFGDKASQHRGAQLSACFGREAGGIATSQRSHSWPLSCVLQNIPNTAASRTTLHSARPSAQHRLIVSLNDPRHFQINDSYLNPSGSPAPTHNTAKGQKEKARNTGLAFRNGQGLRFRRAFSALFCVAMNRCRAAQTFAALLLE